MTYGAPLGVYGQTSATYGDLTGLVVVPVPWRTFDGSTSTSVNDGDGTI